MKDHLAYLRYVARHKLEVLRASRIVGVPLVQALLHDASKFLPSEWTPYVECFYAPDGSKRYNETPAFNAAWNRHQKRNLHHYQAWILTMDDGGSFPLPMPMKYVLEMVADWVGASIAIKGSNKVAEWYSENWFKMNLHPDTRYVVEEMLQQFGFDPAKRSPDPNEESDARIKERSLEKLRAIHRALEPEDLVHQECAGDAVKIIEAIKAERDKEQKGREWFTGLYTSHRATVQKQNSLLEKYHKFEEAVREYGSFNGPEGSHWDAVLAARPSLTTSTRTDPVECECAEASHPCRKCADEAEARASRVPSGDRMIGPPPESMPVLAPLHDVAASVCPCSWCSAKRQPIPSPTATSSPTNSHSGSSEKPCTDCPHENDGECVSGEIPPCEPEYQEELKDDGTPWLESRAPFSQTKGDPSDKGDWCKCNKCGARVLVKWEDGGDGLHVFRHMACPCGGMLEQPAPAAEKCGCGGSDEKGHWPECDMNPKREDIKQPAKTCETCWRAACVRRNLHVGECREWVDKPLTLADIKQIDSSPARPAKTYPYCAACCHHPDPLWNCAECVNGGNFCCSTSTATSSPTIPSPEVQTVLDKARGWTIGWTTSEERERYARELLVACEVLEGRLKK